MGGNAHLRSLDFSGLKVVGIIWDSVSTQLNKIHNKVLAGFRNFYAEILYIISLVEKLPLSCNYNWTFVYTFWF